MTFTGLQSHAASDPWNGRNALDAMITLFVSVGLWRQQLPTHCRVHGIIQEGGTAANIIPDRARAWFMIRSADQAYYDVMKARFRRLCEAAAVAADVEVDVEFTGGATTMNNNHVLARAVGRERWRLRAPRRGARSGVGVDGHGQRVVGRAGDPSRHLDHGRADARATRSRSETRPPRRAPTAPCSSPPPSSPRRRSTCSSTRRSSSARGPSSGRRPAPGRGTMPPGAPRWTADPNRRRPD